MGRRVGHCNTGNGRIWDEIEIQGERGKRVMRGDPEDQGQAKMRRLRQGQLRARGETQYG